ncbi:MAG: transcription termination factor NusA [Phycisphaerae bacterium]|nr:transcription termination factor NusA [Phycisphaerae bacterium]MDD5380672.1 transcription termination factor NusA [Phycisphaerae bacterium]
MSQEITRIVDNIARDKNIDRESIFADLEEAMVSAVRKQFGEPESEITVHIDRTTGEITAFKDKVQIDMTHLGRIPAQTAKQVMIQKIKANERDSIYTEFSKRKGTIVSGSVVRYESGTLIVNLDHRAEGFMPKNEQIMGQSHHPGERIRCLILDVKETSGQVKIILSRTHPDFIRKLFELEVPEISENIIEIRALVREAGYRSKVAVASSDEKVDPVGACVGVRGSRIKNIVDELGGEKIDIVRWNESSQVLISNGLMPAKVSEIALCFELGRATVVVDEDQLSLAIGKHGQNVRLAARLTGWDIDILTPDEYNQGIERLTNCVKTAAGDDTLVDKLIALGVISVLDLEDVGAEPLVSELGIDAGLAEKLIATATEEARRLAAEPKKQAESLLEKQSDHQHDESALGKELEATDNEQTVTNNE